MRTNALKKHQANVRKFKQLKTEKMGLLQGEQIAHCIDSKSFGGKFYYPEFVVTNKGRVWSLNRSQWLSPQISADINKNKSYWSIDPKDENRVTQTVYVHSLVCNYFRNESDKIAIEFFGEDNVQAHHIIAINIPKSLKGRGKRQAKIKQCMKDSCKTNIVYQETHTDHKNDTRLANGNITLQEKTGVDEWDNELKDIRTMMYNSGQVKGNGYGTYYVYSKDENGKLKKSITQTIKLKGVLSKYDVILRDYRVNADENMQFIYDNQDVILDKIKENPPKHQCYDKGFRLNGITVLYALK